MILAADHRTTHRQLATDLGVGTDQMDALLTELQERGRLIADGDDARITEAGQQALAALWAVQQQVEQQIGTELTGTERATLVELLRRVRASAERILRE